MHSFQLVSISEFPHTPVISEQKYEIFVNKRVNEAGFQKTNSLSKLI